ncbi:hypothetical protein PV726_32815 [Streptomyces europaeiscabiei]|uniref:hypothetical protein n=1 Tax=Streptomyces europaeiscabiei TaxID=146819 RepID=UPI0029BB99A9|nr:hypothetical protein [Streptomyces europaeiscabiei]MDX3695039.1 hypothetical protein [Streptomyces europaeiscabiei]
MPDLSTAKRGAPLDLVDDSAHIPDTDVTVSLFIPELDGDTFTRKELDDYRWYQIEADAENGWLRAAETNDQYAWEDEQDRMRAAFFGGY